MKVAVYRQKKMGALSVINRRFAPDSSSERHGGHRMPDRHDSFRSIPNSDDMVIEAI